MRLGKVGERQEMMLECIWSEGGTTTGPIIKQLFKEKYGIVLTKSTINTMLKVLTEKGYVERIDDKAGSAFVYHALVDRESYIEQELARVQERLFGGSADAMCVGIINQNVSQEEFKQARALFEEWYGKDKKE